MMEALDAQITHCNQMQQQGRWIAPWKHPANWLTKQCWKDEINTDHSEEKAHAERKKPTRRTDAPKAMFWTPEDGEEDESSSDSNVLAFKGQRQSHEAY